MSQQADTSLNPIPRPVKLWPYYLAFLTALAFSILKMTIADPDLWGVLSFGALLDQNPGFFPYHDLFSYTAAPASSFAPWIYHEWGSGVVFFQVLKYTGAWGLAVLCLMLNAIMLACCFLQAQKTVKLPVKQTLFSISVLLVFLLGHNLFYAIRCQMFSFALFSIFLWLLQDFSQHTSKRVWLLAPLSLLWVNLHGGYILGFFLMGVYLIYFLSLKDWHRFKPLLLFTALSVLLSGFNPYGWAFHLKMIEAWSLNRSNISEWNPTIFIEPVQGLVLLTLSVYTLYVGWQTLKIKYEPKILLVLILLAFTGWQANLHFKLLPYFLITFLATGTQLAFPEIPVSDKLLRLLPNVLSIVFAAAIVCVLATDKAPYPIKIDEQYTPQNTVMIYPVHAIDYLKQHQTQGNLWVEFSWGEYALWELFPSMKVSMDGRYETLYTPQQQEDNARFFLPPYDTAVLDKYPATNYLLVPSQLSPLIQKLDRLGEWQKIYTDPTASIFQKRSGSAKYQAVIVRTIEPVTTPLSAHMGNLSRFQIQHVH